MLPSSMGARTFESATSFTLNASIVFFARELFRCQGVRAGLRAKPELPDVGHQRSDLVVHYFSVQRIKTHEAAVKVRVVGQTHGIQLRLQVIRGGLRARSAIGVALISRVRRGPC